MATNKRKTTTAIVAGVAAAAMLLGGTFAWTSISQQAKNESAGIVNVGGRLHDDFNGENKDIYVENFTDPLNGGQPIYARIRLDEYMEVGSEAGKYDAESNSYVADRNAKPVVDTARIDDVTTWTTHVPAETCDNCATNESCKIHEHWKWTMGGQTTFMPTFNKDKDSLDADVNGTYQGTVPGDNVYYDDYVVYTTDDTATNVGKNILEDQKEAHDGPIYSVIGTEYYDDDTNTAENTAEGQYRIVPNVTHTAKQTGTATVITMQEWIAGGKTPGNFWVYDTDGWAYWANPIMPGESTGLLLDGIEMIKNPGEKCYYSINVVAQFATVGDWEYFDGEEDNAVFAGTENAKDLLETVSKYVPTVTVSSDSTVVAPGQTAQFTATVSQGQVAGANDPAIEWSLYNADGTAYTGESTIDNSGLLTVAEDEAEGTILTVVARSTEYLGAVGMKSVTVKTPDVAIKVKSENNLSLYKSGESYTETLIADISGDDAKDGKLVWSVKIGNDEEPTYTSVSGAENNTATLSIGTEETTNKIVVTATYTLSSGYSVSADYEIIKDNPIATGDDMTYAYAILTDDGSGNDTYAMTFVRTNALVTANENTYNGKVIKAAYTDFENVDYGGTYTWYGNIPWYSEHETNGAMNQKITTVTVANTLKPNELRWYFYKMPNLTYADLEKIDMSGVSEVGRLFSDCSKLQDVKFPDNWAKDISSIAVIFENCSSLVSVDTTNWGLDSGRLTSISGAFNKCSSLTEVKGIENWTFGEDKIYYYGVFMNCPQLIADCSSWKISRISSNDNRDYSAEFTSGSPNVIPPTWVD